MSDGSHPIIIQGGTGAALSAWKLAKAVAMKGQMGMVRGTALDVVAARQLQLGDRGGHLRRDLAEFPLPVMAEQILARDFIPGGKFPDAPFVALKLRDEAPWQEQLELIVVANFAEVFLVKENYDGLVGIDYLENKVPVPTLPSLFGAMLGGVEYVLMGAGMPTNIPIVIDRLSEGELVERALKVDGADGDDRFYTHFVRDSSTRGRCRGCDGPSCCRL